MFPFRVIHVWLHVHQANTVIKKQAEGNTKQQLRFITYLGTGFTAKTENPGLALSGTCSPREAASIANAPMKGALVLLLLLTLLTPFLRTSFAGTLIHLYIFIGIATSSFPSTSDYRYTHNMLLLNSPLEPRWTLFPVAAFVAGFIITMTWTGNIIYAAIWGIAASSFCLWLVLMSATRVKNVNPTTRTTSNPEMIDSCSTGNTTLGPNNSTFNPQDNQDLYLLYQLEFDT